MNRLASSITTLLIVVATTTGVAAAATPPQWAIDYTNGLKAYRDIIHYWAARQREDGSFGFGIDDDVEMIVGWPGILMATDDPVARKSINRLLDQIWFYYLVQDGYWIAAKDCEHGSETTSYSTPVMAYAEFGSPRIVERMMATGRNRDFWMGTTGPRGHRHMRATWFGSQRIPDWKYKNTDATMNARAWLPIMNAAMYNRDPYLVQMITEWADAWVDHAKETSYGKPFGFLPAEVVFPTDEVGGYTNNWWGSSSHGYDATWIWNQARLQEVLITAYVLTGDRKYLLPARETIRFSARYALDPIEEGESREDTLPKDLEFPPGWRDGNESFRWFREAALGWLLHWYRYVTGDTQFDEVCSRRLNTDLLTREPYDRVDTELVRRAYERAMGTHKEQFGEVLPDINILSSVSNYAAAFWLKPYGNITFGNRCFHNIARCVNVNWPWVDFPPVAAVWKNTGYDTGIFVLEDRPNTFRAALCNVGQQPRRIGAQLFTLNEGPYRLRIGPDADSDGRMDRVVEQRTVPIERGEIVWLELEPGLETLLELRGNNPPTRWRPRPDLGLDPQDIVVSRPPTPGEQVDISVRVHNIGTEPAERFAVEWLARVGDGTILIKRLRVGRLAPPIKCDPSYLERSVACTIPAGCEAIGVALDPDDRVDEIYEGNNVAWVSVDEVQTAWRDKQYGYYGPEKRPSIANVDESELSNYVAPKITNIVLDGRIEEDEWQAAEPFRLLANKGAKLTKPVDMRMAYDDEALYVAVRCHEPDVDKIKDTLTGNSIYYNDSIEIFIDHLSEVWLYHQFVFDTKMRTLQADIVNRHATPLPWDPKVYKGDDFWSAEVKFPFASFDVPTPKPGSRWRINVMKFTTTLTNPEHPTWQTTERSHFSPKGNLPYYHIPEVFGNVWFGERGSVGEVN